jgi:hypothetical protein
VSICAHTVVDFEVDHPAIRVRFAHWNLLPAAEVLCEKR